jgi:hypothetical protein
MRQLAWVLLRLNARHDSALGKKEAEMSEIPREIDTSKPHPARLYDHYLGERFDTAVIHR